MGAFDVVNVWVLQALAWPGDRDVSNKQSGHSSSLWVCLLWSVGAFDEWALQLGPEIGGCLINEVGVAALCRCVSCGL